MSLDPALLELLSGNRSPDLVSDLLHQAILLCPNVLEQPASIVRLPALDARFARYEVIVSLESSDLAASTSDRLLRETHR